MVVVAVGMAVPMRVGVRMPVTMAVFAPVFVVSPRTVFMVMMVGHQQPSGRRSGTAR